MSKATISLHVCLGYHSEAGHGSEKDINQYLNNFDPQHENSYEGNFSSWVSSPSLK